MSHSQTITALRSTEREPHKLTSEAGEVVDIGSTRIRLMVRAPATRGGFSLVEYPIQPRTLVAPLHRHTWEDEHSLVLEGRMGALLGDEIVFADAGELIFKPRRQWHTIWNPGDVPARILEMISPGGFELFFEELAAVLRRSPTDRSDGGALAARYGLETDFDSVPRLCAEHGLIGPDEPR
jgi:mannose-6-phosphate isomerase-like protein (cupin superfamily)